MKVALSLLGLSLLVGCGGKFSAEGSGAAGGGVPDASAGSSGAGGGPGTGGRASSGPGGAVGTGGTVGSAGTAGAKLDSGRDAPGDVATLDGGVACKVDSDCKLVDTCCLGCVAKGADFPVPPCGQLCLVDPCQAANVKGARCFQGTCILAPECDPKTVACDSVPPPCPVGEVASVAGACWSGHCVKASSCRTVNDCTVCDPKTMICGQMQTELGNQFRCVDLPPACANDRSCACAGPFVCVPPFGTCSADQGMTRLLCTCPTC